MRRRKVLVLYEHSSQRLPFSSSHIRLLRPLSHPTLSADIELIARPDYEPCAVDCVIVDRLWRPDISLAAVEKLSQEVHRCGARLLYAIDDDLLGLDGTATDWHMRAGQSEALRFLLGAADALVVTTPQLRDRLLVHNQHISVIQNCLDERLLPGRRLARNIPLFSPARLVIGCMGTRTHDGDFSLILPALVNLAERHSGQIEYQIVGAVSDEFLNGPMAGLPVRVLQPRAAEGEYPLFMTWFTRRLSWDIALAPLAANRFNECKSDIKFLDYSALGAAGIYSYVPAYAGSVQHLQTGWLAENEPGAWLEALERLLADDSLRETISRNANRYLYSQRVLAAHARDWLAVLDQNL